MKFALGTAQFGIPYGIANTTGQVAQAEANTIIDYAKNVGIDTIDTAIAYGQSEKCIGNSGVDGWNLVTKLPEVPATCHNLENWIRENVNNSLSNLGVRRISGLLLHRPAQLLESDKSGLWKILNDLKSEGVVRKIGFSIYSPHELSPLWSRYKPDLVQAPYNVFDRSLVKTGWMQELSSSGVEIHVRSIFLQGLLLMPLGSIPEKFKKWTQLLSVWDDWLVKNGLTRLQATISFALSDPRISRVVVGVDSLNQLKEIVGAVLEKSLDFPDDLYSSDTDLINPSQWNSL
tara:strand:- start:8 stop:874 length:867 start_codon:yes stop_codon:yes gene_type:complete